MRMRRVISMKRVLAALLALPLVGMALSAPTAQADPDDFLIVLATRIPRTTPVAVTGLNTVPVTVEVDAKYTYPDAGPDTTLFVFLKLFSGSGTQDLISMPLKRYAGTTANGSWRGS